MISTSPIYNKGTLINVSSPNKKDLAKLEVDYNIPNRYLTYAVDESERSHFNIDKETGLLVLVYLVCVKSKNAKHFITKPVTFMLKEDQLFVFTTKKTDYVSDELNSIIYNIEEQTLLEYILGTIINSTKYYLDLIEKVNQRRDKLEDKIRNQINSIDITEIIDLEKSLIFFETSLKNNDIALQELKLAFHKGTNTFTMDTHELSQLSDAKVEVQQALEMSQMSSNIIDQLSATYNNLINNNLNITMKYLTIYSIVLTVPAIVTGYFGINVWFPQIENKDMWWIIIIATVVITWILTYILKNLNGFSAVSTKNHDNILKKIAKKIKQKTKKTTR